MSENFLSNVYGAIFTPLKTFDDIVDNQQPPVFEAFMVVVMVSIIGCITINSVSSIWVLALSIISYVVFAVISWVFMAAVIDGLVSIFSKENNFDTLLTLSAFSLLPWLLIGPVNLFKSGGIEGFGLLGVLIAIILGSIIWFWTTILFLVAISKTYKFTAGKIILLAIMPFLASIIVFFWMTGFIGNIIYLIAV